MGKKTRTNLLVGICKHVSCDLGYVIAELLFHQESLYRLEAREEAIVCSRLRRSLGSFVDTYEQQFGQVEI
jgi:hypothetical protein